MKKLVFPERKHKLVFQEYINCFEGQFSFLSNFYYSPFEIEGEYYPSVEHYFQSMKTLDKKERFFIKESITPAMAKKRGRSVMLRSNWNLVRIAVMYSGVRAKFYQHYDLCEKLLATGNAELIEGNLWHDNYWGSCVCHKCVSIYGKNLLGKVLMAIREELR